MPKSKYALDLPYPDTTGLRPDKKQGKLLMQAYSSQYSELTTITQYVYHQIKLAKYTEIAQTIHGIMIVEMHHLNMLGHCINQLGADPRFNMQLQNSKDINWQADLIDYGNNPKQMLLSDISGEKIAVKDYIELSGIIRNKILSDLLVRIAEDEKLHIKLLTDLFNKNFSR